MRDDRPQRERFTETTDLYPKRYPSVKCILRPGSFRKMMAHWPTISDDRRRPKVLTCERHLKVKGPNDPNITGERIVIDHYFTRSWEEWIEKTKRGSCCPLSVRKYELWFDLLNPGLAHPAWPAR